MIRDASLCASERLLISRQGKRLVDPRFQLAAANKSEDRAVGGLDLRSRRALEPVVHPKAVVAEVAIDEVTPDLYLGALATECAISNNLAAIAHVVGELGDRRPTYRVQDERKLVAAESVLQTLGEIIVDHDDPVPAGSKNFSRRRLAAYEIDGVHLPQAGKLNDVLADRGVGASLGDPISRFELLVLRQQQLRGDRRYPQHCQLHEIGLLVHHNGAPLICHRFPSPGAMCVRGYQYDAAADQLAICVRRGLNDGAHSVGAEVDGQLGLKAVEAADQMDVRGVYGRCMHIDKKLAPNRFWCAPRHEPHRIARVTELG